MIKEINEKEYNKKIQELINNIKSNTVVFTNDSAQKQRIRKDKSQTDLFFFAETYFPHYIRAKFGVPHKKMHKETSFEGQITAIAGFRGLGKTTLLSIIKPIWLALNGKIHFNVKVAKNSDLAKERSVAIRCEFKFNNRLINDFGNQLPISSQEEDDFVIKEGCRFLAIGYKTGIRGKLYGSYRPDYIDIDDLEDHNSFNPRIAKDKLQFVCEEAYGALDKGKGIVVWLGNLTHQNSAINLFKKTAEDKTYKGRKMLIIKVDDGYFNPTWKENFTKKDLLTIYNAVGRFGFERHYRMNPIIEGLKFKVEWFRYYDDNDIKNVKFQKIVTYCDPSLGEKKSSDYKAIMTIGFYKKRYYLLDCYLRKASIVDMIGYLYQIHKKYNSLLSMESNLWQKVLWDYIQDLSEDFGYILPVQGIENREKKELRIERLEPYFQWGWLLFPKIVTLELQTLIDQFLGYPGYPNDDGPDAVAGGVRCLRNASSKEEYCSIQKNLANQFSNLW